MAAAPAPSSGRSTLTKILIALAAVAVVVVILLLTGVIGGDDDEEDEAGKPPSTAEVVQELREGRVLAGRSEAPFAMRYTNDWEIVPASKLRAADPPPLAGLERKDKSGVLYVSLRGPIRGGIGNLEKRLPGELKEQIPDFRLQTMQRIKVAGGPALYTSWIRTKTGRPESQLVVPVGNQRSFAVNVFLGASATDAAAELAAMLRTFDTAPTS